MRTAGNEGRLCDDDIVTPVADFSQELFESERLQQAYIAFYVATDVDDGEEVDSDFEPDSASDSSDEEDVEMEDNELAALLSDSTQPLSHPLSLI